MGFGRPAKRVTNPKPAGPNLKKAVRAEKKSQQTFNWGH
jgi:hypothetical protein